MNSQTLSCCPTTPCPGLPYHGYATQSGLYMRSNRNLNSSKLFLVPDLKTLGRGGSVLCCSNSPPKSNANLNGARVTSLDVKGFARNELVRGKPGSVSFHGLTHQLVEESKLESAPFKEGTGSFLWVLAPAALVSSLVLPQFFITNSIQAVVGDVVLSEIVASFASEVIFYAGLLIFLLVADHVQKPYLEFSTKRWGLITGLRGYLSSAFFTMGFKVMAPLFAVYVTWPILGLQGLVAVAPFLVGCVAQLAFETFLDKRGSSCWPLVPVIFEIYRLYQLTKAAHFIQMLVVTTSANGAAISPQVFDRAGALVSMMVTLQVLGVVCLWSLMTFLLRLFPSRPVAEKY
ncbi:hypothetical protein RJ641_032256 [Dillenia turbinata]|uniref:Uncharacterized protein n=1 Tax=Dillenia turbinata TaxID=194707 RepID=A0AAN8ZLN6_9MAGN